MDIKLRSLSKNDEFKELLNGNKISSKYGTFFFKKLINKDIKNFNISVVTKKKLGKANIRIKIKRRIKNILQSALKNTNINFEYSYLFIAKKNVFDDDYTIIKKKILEDLKKIK